MLRLRVVRRGAETGRLAPVLCDTRRRVVVSASRAGPTTTLAQCQKLRHFYLSPASSSKALDNRGVSCGNAATRRRGVRRRHSSSETTPYRTRGEGLAPSRLLDELPSRRQHVDALKKTERFDVIVVGGGATGCGVALDAACRGLKTALVERGDFGRETSARSTKLIWAGIKYLGTACAGLLRWRNILRPMSAFQHFAAELRLVAAAHRERRFLLEKQKHLTRWLPIAVPVRKWFMNDPPPLGHPLFALAPLVLPLLFKIYDALGNFTCPPSYVMSAKTARERFPTLRDPDDVKYVAVFYEGAHNDARTNLAVALAAARRGATIVNYADMTDVLLDETTGRAAGVTCRVVETSFEGATTEELVDVKADAVVFAGGPFTDALRRREHDAAQQQQQQQQRVVVARTKKNRRVSASNDDSSSSASLSDDDDDDAVSEEEESSSQEEEEPVFSAAVAGAAGSHVVLRGGHTPDDMGLLDVATSDGRFLFVVPWEGRTLAGTTDVAGEPTTSHAAPANEVQWILREAANSIETLRDATPRHAASTWRGWRPVARDPYNVGTPPNGRTHDVDRKDAPPLQGHASRDHVVAEHPTTGVVAVVGGKWTTYREMAEDVVDKIVARRSNEARSSAKKKKLPSPPACSTLDVALEGGDGYDEDEVLGGLRRTLRVAAADDDALSDDADVDAVARHLARTYGARAPDVLRRRPDLLRRLHRDFPYLEAEVAYACDVEYACTVADVLALRTRLAYLDVAAAIEVAPTVADIMATTSLRWSDAVRDTHLAHALDVLAEFRPAPPGGTPQGDL